MRTLTLFALTALIVALPACKRDSQLPQASSGAYVAQTWVLPAEAGSNAPDMTRAPDGRVLLSWMNRHEGRRNALQFSSYTEQDGWQSQPRTIAVGNALLANGADAPHLLATADGALWAQWLQSQPDGGAGYDVVLARSRDGGMTWNQITRVNDDGKPAEHGFASLWPHGSDSIGIAWLDGREQAAPMGAMAHADGAHATGAMQLRSNSFNMDLARGADSVLDPHTCDCCQTAVAMTPHGPLLAYRGRTADEVRDIAVLRLSQGHWSAPAVVHADGWKVDACPVSGPALAADGNRVALAWYSEHDGKPLLQLARSDDGGATFSSPTTVAEGENVVGRAAVAVDAQQVWVAWLQEEAQGQRLTVTRYAPDLSKALQTLKVAQLGARGMASGYPKLLAGDGMAWLVWTDSVNGVAHLKGARITRP